MAQNNKQTKQEINEDVVPYDELYELLMVADKDNVHKDEIIITLNNEKKLTEEKYMVCRKSYEELAQDYRSIKHKMNVFAPKGSLYNNYVKPKLLGSLTEERKREINSNFEKQRLEIINKEHEALKKLRGD
ncbi:V16 [Sputnik virophage]|uniref:Uncharacterized protein V16 n=3 Tax=Mimivirus-dependent virus Sputnik TaxID=1932927 RepID=V16_SPTNK|nr:V16 [Sputnik virophage]B4YNF6.1 RecName: Full=Uncharacterized protein V16 [Sputnik virophage]AFH75270.1 hypothetical protein Sputnik2_L16 [Sputnik virophage 2]AFH75290.1 hypothetical protein Sputnik3_L16 [Sputnik virophage 3]UMZ08528.1 hypothetical protein [Mimivirus-dependent virus Sputnik]ACF17000.1 V16 [Sputnik virophage]AUG85003.1 hypothetical protein [Sputnik virophage 2]